VSAIGSDLPALLVIAREAARIAGEVIMPLYHSTLSVELKADRTPVTIADRNAEEAIRRFLERECPGHGIIGEEFGETSGDGRHRWILDPIDGTKSFIRRVPLFGTLVALERDGEPSVGVIACHATGETAYGATGLGAFLNGTPVHVSDTAALGPEALVCNGSTRALVRSNRAAFEAILGTGAGLQTWGDCYGYLMVAAGRADAMLDPEMALWDVAALAPIVREAGGQFTTWSGDESLGDSAAATNGLLHKQLLAMLQAGG
jgi:histidinol phosphatase-like enzyme (inositol monophosphatase family)